MPYQIGFLVFPDFQLIDLAGPFDLVALVSDCRLHLIWKDRLPVTSTSGWGLAPTTTLQDCPALDVLCIPGGSGVNVLMQDTEILNFVRSQAATAHYVTSVCTGALVLGAASHHLLAELGAIPVQERIVADGPVITGGGATAGIDFALDIIARLAGRFEAEVAQLELEYAPAPPLNAGTPRTAPEAVVARVRADSARSVAERERIVADLALT